MDYVSRCPQKLRILRYVTSPLANLHWYRHFSIRYEFYAAEQIQTIIKTESSSFSSTKYVAYRMVPLLMTFNALEAHFSN